MKTKQEVLSFLESKVGTKVVCVGNPSLDGQCVSLIKSLMDFLGVKDPYKARGHAKTCISAYISEGIAKQGAGFLSVFSNKDMGSGYGHIWCNAGDGAGIYYESNGQKPLIVTKGKTYSYDMVCNFDQYINLTESENTQGKYTEEEYTKVRLERDKNWTLYQAALKENEGLSETIKTLQGSHKDFVENLLKTLNPLGNPLGLSDEELVKKLVVEAVKAESDLQDKIKQSEAASAKKQQELEKENKDLREELERLQGEFIAMEKKHEQEILVFKKRLETVQEQIAENKEEKAEIDHLQKLMTAILKLFRKAK